MFLRRSVKLILIISLPLLAWQVFSFAPIVSGYDNLIIHPNLTKASAEIYNRQANEKLTEEQINWIIQGSIAEDTDPRYLNHFYNPATGKGLNDGIYSGQSAKYWAKKQNSVSGDYSLSAILNNYKNGNFKRAYQGIGHIAHLIQDMSVPAHTRNDAHPDGDPYEKWAEQYGKVNLKRAGFISIDSLDQAFDSMASYSNNNFFSEDTIQRNFKFESLQNEKDMDGIDADYAYYNNYRIVKIKNYRWGSEYLFDFKVLLDYWNMLSPKAVSYGAGAIDYFIKQFKEIDKEKSAKQELSFWDKVKREAARVKSNLKYNWGDVFIASRVKTSKAFDFISKESKKSKENLAFFSQASKEVAEGAAKKAEEVIADVGGRVLSSIEEPITIEDLFGSKEAEAVKAPDVGNNKKNKNMENNISAAAKLKNIASAAAESIKQKNTSPPASSLAGEVWREKILKQENKEAKKQNNKKILKSLNTADKQINKKVQKSLPLSAPVKNAAPAFIFIAGNDALSNNVLNNTENKKPEIIITETTIISSPAATSSSSIASFTLSSDQAGSSFEYSLDNGSWQASSSDLVFYNLADGSHNIAARAVLSGNFDKTPAEFSWTIDTRKPELTITNAPAIFSSSTEAIFSFSADEENISFQCQLDSGEKQNCNAAATVSGLAEGKHNFKVFGVDWAGNIGSSTAYSWTVDLTAPTSTVAALEESYVATGFTVSWSGDDSAASALTSGAASFDAQYKIGSSSWQSLMNNTTSTSTVFSIAVDAGEIVSFRARSRDKAGNLGEWSQEAQTIINDNMANYVVISEAQINGATAKDEFVELYNPTSAAISLAGYKLKRKTASGKEYYLVSDFGSSTIPSYGYYLIAHPTGFSSPLSPDITYSSNSYSIAPNNTIILYNKETVVDKVGFGNAQDYEGAAFPANPSSGQSLERKAFATSTAETLGNGGEHEYSGNGYDSNDNSSDFIIRSNSLFQATNNASEPRSQISAGLIHLWHFDECESATSSDSVGNADLPQNAAWAPGKWGCAIRQSWEDPYDIVKNFDSSLTSQELTLSYYWRNSSYPNEGRGHVFLKNEAGQVAAGLIPTVIGIVSTELYYNNNVYFFADGVMPSDSEWHNITLTYSDNSLALYVDAVLKIKLAGNYSLASTVTQIEMKDINWPLERDEIAVWSRALGSEEIISNYNSNAPLEPYNEREIQQAAQKIHSWNFNEGAGNVALDSVGNDDLVIDSSLWAASGKASSSIWHSWPDQYDIIRSFNSPINSRDLSIDFWWRNRSYPNEGRGSVRLQNDNKDIFGLTFTRANAGYYFNSSVFTGVGSIIPDDNAWHHLAIVYDSYAYKLYFYVDGVKKIEQAYAWLEIPITKMLIKGENWEYELDELNIWEGALSENEVLSIYEEG